MEIRVSIDIEDEIRQALSDYITIYCRPLPSNFTVPSVLVETVGGGNTEGRIDSFDVVLESRAENESAALELLNRTIGILRKIAELQTTNIRFITVNSSASWGSDPTRPELALCQARINVIAHTTTETITEE